MQHEEHGVVAGCEVERDEVVVVAQG